MNTFTQPERSGLSFIALKEFIMQAAKSTKQQLFEQLRHTIATKHQVPAHLTEAELEYILSLLKKPEDRV